MLKISPWNQNISRVHVSAYTIPNNLNVCIGNRLLTISSSKKWPLLMSFQPAGSTHSKSLWVIEEPDLPGVPNYFIYGSYKNIPLLEKII